jgi:hypothetical protein
VLQRHGKTGRYSTNQKGTTAQASNRLRESTSEQHNTTETPFMTSLERQRG